MKKISIYIFLIITLVGLFSPTLKIHAQTDSSYHLLSPLPCDKNSNGVGSGSGPGCEDGKLESIDPTSDDIFSKYLNLIIRLVIGLCAVMAVVMIVIGGIEYATSELISSKEAGKERIRGALLGLLLALGAYTLLFTVNPDLLKTDVEIAPITLNVSLQEFKILSIPVGGTINSKNAGSRGTVCDANSIISAGQAYGLTNKQAETFSCILYFENRSCVSVKNYKWQEGQTGHSAFGYFQINLIGNAPAFENQACWDAAGTKPINCRSTFSYSGTPENNVCIRAASDFNCQVAAATYLVKRRISNGQPEFADWTVGTASESHANQASCVN